MAIQVPNETPTIQQALASGLASLQPVERAGGIGEFARAVVEVALAAADAAEVEAQDGEAALDERVVEIVDDLVVHRAAELRVRMQDQRNRAVARRFVMIAGF